MHGLAQRKLPNRSNLDNFSHTFRISVNPNSFSKKLNDNSAKVFVTIGSEKEEKFISEHMLYTCVQKTKGEASLISRLNQFLVEFFFSKKRLDSVNDFFSIYVHVTSYLCIKHKM